MLTSLPSRASGDSTVNVASYYLALEGVSRFAIQTATRQIMQGALGHGFLPSAPEIRMQCDEVMRPIREMEARDRREAAILREQREDQRQRAQSQSTWTPESRARESAKWQEVKAKMQAEKVSEQANTGGYDTSKEAALARLQKAAEDNGNQFNLDSLKSSISSTFKQVGTAA